MLEDARNELRRASNIGGLLLILHVTALLFISIGVGIGLQYVIDPYSNYEAYVDFDTVLFYVLVYPVCVPLLLLFYYHTHGKRHGAKLRDVLRKPDASVWQCTRWILICLAITYLTAMLSNLAIAFLEWLVEFLTGYIIEEAESELTGTLLGNSMTLVATILFAPFFEESLFRGTLYRGTVQYANPYASALLCGIAFGLWHINYGQLIYATVIGFCSCLLCTRTGSLIPSIVLHAIINFIGTLELLFYSDYLTLSKGLLAFEEYSEEEIDAMLSLLGDYLPTLVVYLGCGILVFGFICIGIFFLILEFCKHKESFHFPKGSFTFGESCHILFTSPLLCIGLIYLLVLTILRAIGVF